MNTCAIALAFLFFLMVPTTTDANGGPARYSVSMKYASAMAPSAGQEATLDVKVTNLRGKKSGLWIAAIIFDFSPTGILPLAAGALPPDWQGLVEPNGVVTYTAGHGVSAIHQGDSIRLAPRIRIPADHKVTRPPRVFIVPLVSMAGFRGPALRALPKVKHEEVKATVHLETAP